MFQKNIYNDILGNDSSIFSPNDQELLGKFPNYLSHINISLKFDFLLFPSFLPYFPSSPLFLPSYLPPSSLPPFLLSFSVILTRDFVLPIPISLLIRTLYCKWQKPTSLIKKGWEKEEEEELKEAEGFGAGRN